MQLWVESLRTVVYVQNIISHSSIGNKNPEEMFTREKNENIQLNIFGCLVFIHVPKEKRTKLDPSRKKGIFVGYSD